MVGSLLCREMCLSDRRIAMEFWIARDKDGSLSIFKNEPFLSGSGWKVIGGDEILFISDSDSFPGITYENSPKKVKIELI